MIMTHRTFLTFFTASVLALLLASACHTPQHTEAASSGRNLIIFYDGSVGSKPLLKAAKKYGSKVLYQYRNFSGITVTIPSRYTTAQAIDHYRQVKGVLSVQKDRKMQLMDNEPK